MTPSTFYARMQEIWENQNLTPQEQHAQMDALMCELLESLGYSDGIGVFEKTK